jgi:hypothetical protein
MFTKLIGSLAIAVALNSSGWAATSSVVYTFSSPLDTLASSSVDLPGVGQTRTVNAGDDFLDTFYFTLSQNSDVFGGFVSALATHNSLVLKGLVFDSISLIPSVGATQTSASLPSFGFNALSAGSYQLTVKGHAIGSQGGSYSGVLAAEALPIPEPETMALSLAGLALVALLLRRRSILNR